MELRKSNGTVKQSDKSNDGHCDFCDGACTTRDVGIMLSEAGLRLTRQRLQLAHLLFGAGDRHFTADTLHEDALRKGISVSLGTIYNTLQLFVGAGLLRRLAIDDQKSWYDTNMSEHHHYYFEDNNLIFDIGPDQVALGKIPPVPEGMEISRIEVVVRLKRRRGN